MILKFKDFLVVRVHALGSVRTLEEFCFIVKIVKWIIVAINLKWFFEKYQPCTLNDIKIDLNR
jgi:hypothetical protein